jgi:2-isopropylmalate synthase
VDNYVSRKISIFDSTLRDGEQAPGNAMRPEQKRDVALAIEAIGVDVIETGFPSSSPSDYQATRLIADSVTTARIATLSRAKRKDVELAVEAGGTQRHHVQIMATGSETHLRYKRKINQAQAQREVIDTISYVKSLGAQHVSLAIEDASRGSDGLLRPLIEESVAAGADIVVLADTTGCMTPVEYGGLVGRVRSWIPPEIVVSTHCHDDLGLSLANALAGIQAGADEVQVTLAGIGERAGNTALEELTAVLAYKGAQIGATTTAMTGDLYHAFEVLCRTINLSAPRNKAIFGVNAFATQAGIHQAGLLCAPITYEYVEPARFGRERVMVLGRHSGRAVLRCLFADLDLPVDEQLVDSLYQEYILNCPRGEYLDLSKMRELIAERVCSSRVML